MVAEMIFDDRLDPSQTIRSQIDRRIKDGGVLPEFVKISYAGDSSTYKVRSDMLGSIKERTSVRRCADQHVIKTLAS